jgi:hypothetical protein
LPGWFGFHILGRVPFGQLRVGWIVLSGDTGALSSKKAQSAGGQ